MGIGPAKTKGVDPYGQLSLCLQRPGFGNDIDIETLAINVGVDALHADRGRNTPVLQTGDGLDQPCHAGSRLQVPKVAFDRPDREWSGSSAHAQGLTDGSRLDRITDCGSGTMGLEVVETIGCYAGIAIYLSQEFGLSFGAGDSEPGFPTVGIDRTRRHHRQNGIAVSYGLLVLFEEKNAAALGTNVAIGRGIEYVATAPGRKHGGLGKGQEPIGMKMQTHPPRSVPGHILRK